MFRKVSGERPDRVSFLLVPNFSMSAFTAMLEALRLANYTTGRTLYEWEILSRDGDVVEAIFERWSLQIVERVSLEAMLWRASSSEYS